MPSPKRILTFERSLRCKLHITSFFILTYTSHYTPLLSEVLLSDVCQYHNSYYPSHAQEREEGWAKRMCGTERMGRTVVYDDRTHHITLTTHTQSPSLNGLICISSGWYGRFQEKVIKSTLVKMKTSQEQHRITEDTLDGLRWRSFRALISYYTEITSRH